MSRRGSDASALGMAFLLAAAALPAAVVVFFVLASVIPRWTVAPPAYDLLLRTESGYGQSGPRVSVDYNVRDGQVEATVRPLPPTSSWSQGNCSCSSMRR